MFFRKPILPGASDLDQLDKIWQLCGTPTPDEWPEYDLLPGCEGVKSFGVHPRRLRKTYETFVLLLLVAPDSAAHDALQHRARDC